MVGRVGLEPTCFCVSGLQPPAVAAVPPADMWSEWRDSNSRPSGPKPDALRKLSYAPIINGAPDRTRTCTERTLIPSPLPGLGYWSIFGAVNGSRTRDLRLGKPMFCQLDYYCMLERHSGFEPEPSVWKTDMLGHYTNATNIIVGRIDRTRTCICRSHNPVLCQLSYDPHRIGTHSQIRTADRPRIRQVL